MAPLYPSIRLQQAMVWSKAVSRPDAQARPPQSPVRSRRLHVRARSVSVQAMTARSVRSFWVTFWGRGCPVFQCREEPPFLFRSFYFHYARSDILIFMSQKVVIERVLIRGAAPYIGMCATPDGQQTPLYSANPDIVMRWLCDGWRCRYNQLRSRRTRWDRNTQTAIPLGRKPDMRSDRQVRLECSWLTAMPAMVLQSPNRIENTDWWSANKRRKTLKKKHRNPGAMPGFKNRRDDLYFVCWHNKGTNANYHRLKTGITAKSSSPGRTPAHTVWTVNRAGTASTSESASANPSATIRASV